MQHVVRAHAGIALVEDRGDSPTVTGSVLLHGVWRCALPEQPLERVSLTANKIQGKHLNRVSTGPHTFLEIVGHCACFQFPFASLPLVGNMNASNLSVPFTFGLPVQRELRLWCEKANVWAFCMSMLAVPVSTTTHHFKHYLF